MRRVLFVSLLALVGLTLPWDGGAVGQQTNCTQIATIKDFPLDARTDAQYGGETNVGNLITDGMRAKTGAEVAIQNSGGIRSNKIYDVGSFTDCDARNILIIKQQDGSQVENTLVTFKVTGAVLKKALEAPVRTADYAAQLSGVKFKWDISRPAGDKVYEVVIGNTPLDLKKEYMLSVNNFMADPNGSSDWAKNKTFEGLTAQDLKVKMSDMLIEYAKKLGTISIKPEGRITQVGCVKVGESKVDLDAHSTLQYAGADTGVGNLITDAMRTAVINALRGTNQPVVAIQNSGGIRSNTTYPAGSITNCNVLDLLSIGNIINTIKVYQMKGDRLYKMYTAPIRLATRFGDEYAAQIAGALIKWDSKQPKDTGITEVKIGTTTGSTELLSPNKEYIVVINSFMDDQSSSSDWKAILAELKPIVAPGGKTDFGLISDAVIAYIKANTPINPKPEGRITKVK
ncbi:5'-nucleotidase C-terminal domain-containing protein [Candidatus Acetothermia bacterium]|nr:5'-nucleotidase C-terminal domain-containing protein [Candidatus Acetothermia bacterium]